MKNNKNKIKVMVLTALSDYFNIVIAVFMVLILIFGFLFIISPKREAIADELKLININKSNEKENLENLKSKISIYIRRYKQTNESGRKKIDKMLPKEVGEGELMVQIEKLARKKGLLLDSVSVVPRKATKARSRGGLKGKIEELPQGIGAIDIDLKVQGVNYESMKDLLDEFEKNLRLMDIVNLGFSPGGNSLNLKIVTYYSK